MAHDNTSSSDRRDPHRDNDDVRDPFVPNDRAGTDGDSRSEARGDARDNNGNTARGTDAEPTGPEGNDKTKRRPRPDSFDADLNAGG